MTITKFQAIKSLEPNAEFVTHNDEIEDEVHDPYAENEEQLEQHADELPIAENVTSF